jgi:hypothetical protein
MIDSIEISDESTNKISLELLSQNLRGFEVDELLLKLKNVLNQENKDTNSYIQLKSSNMNKMTMISTSYNKDFLICIRNVKILFYNDDQEKLDKNILENFLCIFTFSFLLENLDLKDLESILNTIIDKSPYTCLKDFLHFSSNLKNSKDDLSLYLSILTNKFVEIKSKHLYCLICQGLIKIYKKYIHSNLEISSSILKVLHLSISNLMFNCSYIFLSHSIDLIQEIIELNFEYLSNTLESPIRDNNPNLKLAFFEYFSKSHVEEIYNGSKNNSTNKKCLADVYDFQARDINFVSFIYIYRVEFNKIKTKLFSIQKEQNPTKILVKEIISYFNLASYANFFFNSLLYFNQNLVKNLKIDNILYLSSSELSFYLKFDELFCRGPNVSNKINTDYEIISNRDEFLLSLQEHITKCDLGKWEEAYTINPLLTSIFTLGCLLFKEDKLSLDYMDLFSILDKTNKINNGKQHDSSFINFILVKISSVYYIMFNNDVINFEQCVLINSEMNFNGTESITYVYKLLTIFRMLILSNYSGL